MPNNEEPIMYTSVSGSVVPSTDASTIPNIPELSNQLTLKPIGVVSITNPDKLPLEVVFPDVSVATAVTVYSPSAKSVLAVALHTPDA